MQTSHVDTLSLFQHEREVLLVESGATVFLQGDEGSSAFVLLSGEVQIEVGGRVIERLTPGSIFGEMAIISSEPRSATARAVSDSRMAVLSDKRFTYLVQQTPRFALYMMRVMADRLRRTNSLAEA